MVPVIGESSYREAGQALNARHRVKRGQGKCGRCGHSARLTADQTGGLVPKMLCEDCMATRSLLVFDIEAGVQRKVAA